MIRLCVIALALLASAVQAQDILVRSGDHGSFTRLVFDVAPNARWSMAQEGTRLTVSFPDHRGRFSLEQIFNRIDQSRIAAVSETDAGVTIELACDCSATAFASGPDMVVLDVSRAKLAATTGILWIWCHIRSPAQNASYGVRPRGRAACHSIRKPSCPRRHADTDASVGQSARGTALAV